MEEKGKVEGRRRKSNGEGEYDQRTSYACVDVMTRTLCTTVYANKNFKKKTNKVSQARFLKD
jgi:hypothetical protein